ncbi:hypothetical protein FOIG_16933 [Fusarium odoratissimum NRRL 54006]|uniref:Uncharacterized protein n=1 Tax=Fusarium odoratissimum (strain NRRL 54006) TaxID=1089451 RepID=X0ILM9_FUSO5|nr:uncharacterized protein FOIG_16933 [Fusarium odoratissimum NRRL 54006]EXL89783.1 hypothetical protein FOIG_16933 [Fusarium odoratissimum NRRL 54006]
MNLSMPLSMILVWTKKRLSLTTSERLLLRCEQNSLKVVFLRKLSKL